jgi:hypothetical protein
VLLVQIDTGVVDGRKIREDISGPGTDVQDLHAGFWLQDLVDLSGDGLFVTKRKHQHLIDR